MSKTNDGLVNPELDQVIVRRIGAEGTEAALLEFQGALRDQLIASFRAGYLSKGRYLDDARAVSPRSAMAMGIAGSAGVAAVASGSFSSTLYMATASPASLMHFASGGVGSAIMGPTGIIGQAAFLPVASSLPVVVPILAIQALSSAMMLQQFEQIDRKLEAIKSTLDIVLARAEATHSGELLAASTVIDDVYEQYELNGSFSGDMLTRLALAERDVHRHAARARVLIESQPIEEIARVEEVQRANYDVHTAMLSSFLALRTAYLRMCVDMQENPASVRRDVDRLKKTLEGDIAFWQQLMHRSERLRDAIAEREAQLQDMNWVKRNLPDFVGGRGNAAEKKIAALKDAYLVTLESEKAIMESFLSLIESAKKALCTLENEATSASGQATLVYWRDDDGEHSFVTEQLSVTAQA